MPEPVWVQLARAEIGDQEIRDSTKIIGWAKSLGGWIASYYNNASKIPWCGLFVDEILTKAACHTIGDKSLGALNWASWGQPLTAGCPGAVLVFKRPGGGHVGFYVGEDATSYFVLGGNQADSVCIERISKDRCVALRWPTESNPIGGPLMMASNGIPVSTNEA
jgi:uncharacterized protein (TIGR02594 family)